MKSSVLLFALGVLWVQGQAVLPSFWPLLAGGLGLAAICRPFRSGPSRAGWLLACGLLGVGWATWQAELRLADALDPAWEGRDVLVQGVVATLPQAFERGQRFEFDVEAVSTAGAVLPTRLLLNRYRPDGTRVDEAGSDFLPGQRWRFTVRLKRPHGNANPGAFDYEAWLLERGIRATGYVRPGPAELLDEQVLGPTYLIERMRAGIRERFAALLPVDRWPWMPILVALAVGDQKGIEGDLWSVFNKTGTVHLMSISGLHVTMVAGLLGALCQFLWRRVPALAMRLPAQQAGVLAAGGAAFFYAMLAGFGVPAQRTLYMLLVACAALWSARLVAPGRILALALLVVLLVDPWAVMAPGFWLSFGAVAALLFVGSARLHRLGHWRERLRSWGVVQWVATLASLPVLLLVFQQFSLVSPLANALAVPVISFVVTPLALLGALLPWWPILGLAHAVLDLLMAFLFWCAAWPVWQAPAPPGWAALAAAAGVALCLLPGGVPGRWLGGILLVPAVFWPVARVPFGEARIDVLDVGQGQAVVIRTRDHVLIDDPGPRYGGDVDAGQRVVVPFLRWLGVDRIDTLMVTHRDSDHAGGMGSVLAAMPVGRLLSSLPDAVGDRCRAGERWTWDGVDFAVLHPSIEGYAGQPASNHLSCVLSVTSATHRMLLAADIEAVDEAALLKRDTDAVKADILLAPHHGSRTSSTADFIAAVDADEVLFSSGYRNRFGHPHPEIAARYASTGARDWRTERDGALRIRLAPDGFSITAWRREHPRYWHGQ